MQASGRRRVAGLALLGLLVAGAVAGGQPRATAAGEPLRFTAAGDFSTGNAMQGVLDAVAGSGSQLHLALGDLSYGVTGQEQAWCDLVTSRVGPGFPFQLISGNHESNGQNGTINDFSACLPNQLPGLVGSYGRQWYVDVPAAAPVARFVMVSPALPYPDGTWSYAAGTARYAWTAAAIDGARAAGVPWVVVGMHKPCLSIGQYSCEPGADLINLLVSKRVDLVLSGHEHIYQRTKQLSLSAACPGIVNTYLPACVTDADSDLVKGAGTVFATVGTGGIALRDVNLSDPEAPYMAAWSGNNATPTWGALSVHLDADTLGASFLRGAGQSFTDAFTIRPGAAPPPPPPAPQPLVADDFARTVAAGWGPADVGGPWAVSSSANTSVGAGVGQLINRTAGSTVTTSTGATSASSDARTTLAIDKPATGSGTYLSVVARRVGTSEYRGRVKLLASGALNADLQRAAGATETTIAGQVGVAGGSYVPGQAIHVRVQATGTSPTTVRMKVWRAGSAEPSGWLLSTTDPTAGLQAAGSTGLRSYISSGATNAPVTTSVDTLRVDSPAG